MDAYLYVVFRSPTTLLGLGILIFAGLLLIARLWLRRHKRPLTLWRCFCFLPLLACVVHLVVYYHAAVFYFRSSVFNGLAGFGPLYLAAVLAALLAICPRKAWLRRLGDGLTLLFCAGLLLIVTFTHSSFLGPMLHNYGYLGWTDSFVRTVEQMRQDYVLSDWKEIDYDALLEAYVPQVQAAEAAKDPTAFGLALLNCCEEFSDGHVSLVCADPALASAINDQIGLDHGLALLPRADGAVVAAAVAPGSAAEAAGIHLGTVITSWNGVPVDEARDSVSFPNHPPVQENEEPMRTLLLGGTGGDKVKMGYLADDGSEQVIILTADGSYYQRFSEVYAAFSHASTDENFSWRMLDEHCGYLYIAGEWDKMPMVIYSVVTDDAEYIANRVNGILEQMKAQGMTQLILDIRNNTGGLPSYDAAIASLFYTEPYYSCRDVYTSSSGRKSAVSELIVPAGGAWAELPVVLLVNQNTVSAGDELALLLGRLPNVTLMGITPSNCSFQTTGGCSVLGGGLYLIKYPVIRSIDPDGQPHIDTASDRVSRIGLEHQIPFDETAIETIFGSAPADYELGYARNYLAAHE